MPGGAGDLAMEEDVRLDEAGTLASFLVAHVRQPIELSPVVPG